MLSLGVRGVFVFVLFLSRREFLARVSFNSLQTCFLSKPRKPLGFLRAAAADEEMSPYVTEAEPR